VASGDTAEAEARFRRALELRARHPRATLGLARVLAASGRPADASALLETVTADGELGAEIDRLAAELRMHDDGTGDEATLRATLEENPADLGARLTLGRLHVASGRYTEALELFLEVVRRDRDFEDAAARKAMLDIFTLLGRDDPIVDEYQRKLSQVMFS